MTWEIRQGDCLERLAEMPDGSVQCCITSPPYFGLRDYGHDGQIGLEATPDEYVARLVGVFREVRRVLRDDGTLWLNLGDSYAAGTGGQRTAAGATAQAGNTQRGVADHGYLRVPGVKPKDLLGIPWLVAFALRADGWVLRQEVIWQKPNPMPESVTDRCTRAHEQVFMFSKAKWSGPPPGRYADLSEQDARWLALFLDTEGNISIKKHQRNGKEWWGAQIAVANTHRPLLEAAQAMTGGTILERRQEGKNATVYYWQTSNKAARDLLLRLYPYLMVKKRQARIAIHLESLLGRSGKPVSEERSALLSRLHLANMDCNGFGDPDLSWVPEPKLGRWTSQPYFYDAEAISEESVIGAGAVRNITPGTKGAASTRNDGDRYGVVNDGTRNRRSVWTVPTAPYAEAHFATFPPKLIEPMVLAGSARDACGVCGAPWERVTDTEHVQGRKSGAGNRAALGDVSESSVFRTGLEPRRTTTGWVPTCEHSDDSGSSVVLDPFAGAGTTGVVALRHQRSFIGIELSADYCELARRRIRDDEPLFNYLTEVAA